MPFIRVNCPKKALSPEQKATLAAPATNARAACNSATNKTARHHR
jgi:phenylpyruvate tautomerase PptA (4-oxalocrotonate tautomerase family)